MDPLPEKVTSAAAKKRLSSWLLWSFVAVCLLLLVLLLIARHFVSSPEFIKKIQQTVVEQTGVELAFQSIDFSFSPYPTILLQKVTVEVPERIRLGAAEVQLSPSLLPLLSGNLRLARLVLEKPVANLALPVSGPEEPRSQANPLADTLDKLAKAFATLDDFAPDLVLVVREWRFSVGGLNSLLYAEDLNLKLDLSADDPLSIRASWHGDLSTLSIRRNGKLEVLRDIRWHANVAMQDAGASLSLKNLVCAEPGLNLSGRLTLEPHKPKITLDLSGEGIDVDATRRIALSLAGDIDLNREVFSYLTGGMIPRISVHSEGETAAELGDLKNLRIEGRLQRGRVSIPPLKLDLTELDGDVLIAGGILTGTNLSTRLEGSSGQDGSLKVGLSSDSDLFQLELMLNADLAQAKKILIRIVKASAFTEKLDRITLLQGTGTGKLTLGDSLSEITAEVDVTGLDFNAEYQGVPFPLKVNNGQMSFSEKNIRLKAWSGFFGQSEFSSFDCLVGMGDALNLDVHSGSLKLSLGELHPWLASFDGMPDELNDLKEVSGLLNLSSAHFKGVTNRPEEWQFAATGSVDDLHVTTPRWPAEIKLAEGHFTLDPEQLSFEKFKTGSLDADLTLSGVIKGVSQGLGSLSITIDGTLGEDAVTQLMNSFELPADYTIRTPLTLSATKIDWQKETAISFAGDASVNQGPHLTFDAVYRPGQILINKLIVKDRHSDANMALNYTPDLFSLNFSGVLHSETLDELFVQHKFGKSRTEGDFSVKGGGVKTAVAAAEGQLKVSELIFPLPSGDNLAVEQLVLTADGTNVKAEASSLAWRDYNWEPVNATIGFSEGAIQVELNEAKLCGIDSPGTLTINDQEFSLAIKVDGRTLDVEKSYFCLTDGRVKMTGTMDITSQLKAQGQVGQLLKSIVGPLQMSFSNGTIEQSKALARTLEVLNVSEIVKGRLPKLDSGGFDYATITVQGDFKDGKLLVEKVEMDGETLDVLGYGEVDLEQGTVNIELLAAPFQTVDSVIKNIPGVNYLLAGSLVAIPVSIKGRLDDPKVRIMSASSVGGSLLKLGERTIKSPLKLIETIIPGKEQPPK